MIDYLKNLSLLSVGKSMPSFFQTLLFALILNMPLVAFAHDMAHQEEDTIENIHDFGYVNSKKLSITWPSMVDIYNTTNPFNPSLGRDAAVRNAKSFLKSMIEGTIVKFSGVTYCEKRIAFSAVLVKILRQKNGYLDLDITEAEFSPGIVLTQENIRKAVNIFFEKLPVEDPRETLLWRAKILCVLNARSLSKNETVGDLLNKYYKALDDSSTKELILDDIATLADFGKNHNKTLQEKIDSRLAKHKAGKSGKYEKIGLDQDEDKISFFYDALYCYNQKSIKKFFENSLPSQFMDHIIKFYEEGFIKGINLLDLEKRDVNTVTMIEENLVKLVSHASELEIENSLLKKQLSKTHSKLSKNKEEIPEEEKEEKSSSFKSGHYEIFKKALDELLSEEHFKKIITMYQEPLIKKLNANRENELKKIEAIANSQAFHQTQKYRSGGARYHSAETSLAGILKKQMISEREKRIEFTLEESYYTYVPYVKDFINEEIESLKEKASEELTSKEFHRLF